MDNMHGHMPKSSDAKKTADRNKEIEDLKKKIAAINEREQKSAGFKVKDKRGGKDSVIPDSNAEVMELEKKIRRLEREEMSDKDKTNIDNLKKEINDLNRREQESYKTENFKIKDKRLGTVDPDIEKLVLQKEDEIRRLEDQIRKREEENVGIMGKLKTVLGFKPDLGEAEKEKEKLAQDIKRKQEELDALKRKFAASQEEPREEYKSAVSQEAKPEEDWAKKFEHGKNASEVTKEEFEARAKELKGGAGKKVEHRGGTGDRTEAEWQAKVKEVLEGSDKNEKEFHAPVPVGKEIAKKAEQEKEIAKLENKEVVMVDKDKETAIVNTKEQIKIPKRLDVISVDEIVKSAAWRQAEEKVRQLLHEPEKNMQSGGSRWKSVFNNIWAGIKRPDKMIKKSWVRMGEEGYKQKYYQEALEQMTKNQNLMVELKKSYSMGKKLEITDPNLKRDENYQILQKVLEEYSNSAAEMEEKGNKITDPRVDLQFQKMMYAFQKSSLEGKEWTREQFEKKQRSLINGLKKKGLITNADFLGTATTAQGAGRKEEEVAGGHMYATNLYDIAQDYKNHLGLSIEDIAKGEKMTAEQKELLKSHVQSTLELDINLGAKMADVMNKRPVGTFNNFDKAVGWMQSKGGILGRIASNPGSMAILGAVGAEFAKRGVVRAVGVGALGATGLVTGAWIPIMGAAIAAGSYGAIRRNRELKNDRAMHQRQKTMGKEFTDFRRGKLDEFQYDIKSTAELNAQLDAITSKGGGYNGLDNNQKAELASIFSRFKTELALEREYREGRGNRTVDLISAASQEEGEKYGTHYMSKTDLKIRLYKYLKDGNLIDETGKPTSEEFQALMTQENIRLLQNIKDADKAFDSYKTRSALTMGGIGAVSGAVGAFVGQEVTSRVLQHFGAGERVTAYDTLFNQGKMAEASSRLAQGSIPQDVYNTLKLRDDGTIDASALPAGWKMMQTEKGTMLIHETMATRFNHDKPLPEELIKSLKTGPDGKIDPSSLPKSWSIVENDKGGKFIRTVAEGQAATQAVPVKPKDFIKNHEDMFTKIKRGGWADNNTPKPDKNELKLWWGGQKGTGIDKNGNFVLDIRHMKPEGSFHKGKHWNPEALMKAGKLKMLISLSKDTQNEVIELNVDNYQKALDPNSEIGKKLFRNVNGKAEFLGKYVEIAALEGQKNGTNVYIPLATLEGKGLTSIQDIIPSGTEEIPFNKVIEKGTEEFPLDILEGKKFGTPWAVPAPAGASRWQLENEKSGKDKKTGKEKPGGLPPKEEAPVPAVVNKKESREVSKERRKENLGGDQAGSAKEGKTNEKKNENPGNGDKKSQENPGKEKNYVEKAEGNRILMKNRDIFNDLNAIIGGEYDDHDKLLADITNVRKEDSRNGNPGEAHNNFDTQRRAIEKIYASFNRKYPDRMTLAEFKYCLWKRLADEKKDGAKKSQEKKRTAEGPENEQRAAA